MIGFFATPGVADVCSFFFARKAANLGILLAGLLADSVRPGNHKCIDYKIRGFFKRLVFPYLFKHIFPTTFDRFVEFLCKRFQITLLL